MQSTSTMSECPIAKAVNLASCVWIHNLRTSVRVYLCLCAYEGKGSTPSMASYCEGATWGSGKGGGRWVDEAAGEKLFTISEENAFWLTCTELDEATS